MLRHHLPLLLTLFLLACSGASPSVERESGGATGEGTEATPARDPGKTAGKVTLEDFLAEAGVTEAEIAASGAAIEATNQRSLEAVRAMVEDPAGEPRDERAVLAAIASDVMPRYVARVGGAGGFGDGHFGYAGANQLFATEPIDLVGLSAAEALIKVGWTEAQVQGQVGEEIAIAILDTATPVVNPETGVEASPGVRGFTWADLQEVAMDAEANAWFHSQLPHIEGDKVGTLTAADLPALFELASQTPVGAAPDTEDPLRRQAYALFRMALAEGLSASELYSGMGATISERGEVGAREVMVLNRGTGFVLTPENSAVISLGVLEQAEVDALLQR